MYIIQKFTKDMKKISPILALIVIALLTESVISKAFDASKVVIALNCGTKTQQVSTPEGSFKYVPDEKYVKGSSVGVDYHNDPVASDAEIKFSLDKEVYMYQRHTYQEMTYDLPVKKGINTLIIKFAEMYFQKPGQRVFNIKIGNKIVLENFDVIQKSGAKFAAHEQYIEVDIKNDGVYYQGTKIPQGLQNNKLKLSFAKGKADNPIVQAIVVYHDSVQNSPKKQFLLLKSKWNTQQEMLKAKKQEKDLKQLIQIQKKKQKTLIRNDQLLLDEDSDSTTKIASNPSEKFGFLRRLLMGPIGILGWAALFGITFVFLHKNIFRMGPLPKLSKTQ